MMTVASSRTTFTLEEFLVIEPEPGIRLEWCAGLVYAMSGGTPEHSRLCVRASIVLDRVAGGECSVFGSSADIWVESTQFYGQADASLVCGALRSFTVRKKDRVLGEAITNPVVIVEVLSPSTEARDRGEKFEAYKGIPSLAEYVLVAQDERRIEVRRRIGRGWSREVAVDGEIVRVHGHDVPVAAFYE